MNRRMRAFLVGEWWRLMQRVGQPRSQLKRILPETRRRVVQERVDGAEAKAEAFVYRHRDSGAAPGRIGAGVVPGGRDGKLLGENHATEKFVVIPLREGGPKKILVET